MVIGRRGRRGRHAVRTVVIIGPELARPQAPRMADDTVLVEIRQPETVQGDLVSVMMTL